MKTTRIVAGIAAGALTLGLGGIALAQAAPPQDRPYGQGSAVQMGGEDLSDAERATLQMMVDEERMARDLYDVLGERYPDAPQFRNITHSEQRHYDATLRLADAYGLDRPSATPGTYENAEVQKLYDEWLAAGQKSVEAAYQVGVELETADIADLKAAIEESDNVDLDRVYGHLLAGSENHLEAFQAGADWEPGTGGQGMKGHRHGNGNGNGGQGRMGAGMNGQGGQLRDGSCLEN